MSKQHNGRGGVYAAGEPENFVERVVKPVKVQQDNHSSPGLECLICFERYSKDDIDNGLYQLETFICSRCYATMQKAPHEISCFGKPTFILPSGAILYGYNPEVTTCREECLDRNICARIVYPPEET